MAELQKICAVFLIGLICVPYFLGKLYWGKADPLRLSGWCWFFGFVLSLGIFGYGFYLLLNYAGEAL